MCFGDDLTFSCQSSGVGLLVWTVSALPGVSEAQDVFGLALNNGFQRITSPDKSFGPNPTSITILNATAADNGAKIYCRIVNGISSEGITLSIRE